ncbi:hypothetical protein [Thalassobacillus pellis]|uniref:hypothetical protein n=1 Tax=Thalassobacillus pellis TaxID=748008 RepID=UPI001960457F|nr:hypothetical protein [Thalassobacillus pellis]MBM7551344.1 hypothetical protein [Thalassobacillus pellis]
MDGFWIGVLAAIIAVISIISKRNRDSPAKRNKVIFVIGLAAAFIGVIGYIFLGWRF